MTIEEVKKSIEEKLGGYQIDPAKIRDYIENPGEFTEDFTPTMWLFNFTEIEMPEEELGGVYCVHVKQERERLEYNRGHKLSTPKECLIFLRSEDGINIMNVHAMFPFQRDEMDRKRINMWVRSCFPDK